MFYLVKVSPIA